MLILLISICICIGSIQIYCNLRSDEFVLETLHNFKEEVL